MPIGGLRCSTRQMKIAMLSQSQKCIDVRCAYVVVHVCECQHSNQHEKTTVVRRYIVLLSALDTLSETYANYDISAVMHSKH